MKYRPEIDGLRAVAVIPVILFHAGLEGFAGGFVGVDVFFVISGYLITTIIADELAENRFSLLNFYERRARRILPALFFVVLCCLPVAWLLMLPADLKDFAQSLVGVATFSSNILFWRESGYFDTTTELKPLLHTWSLAVEEQYYVFFPLLLMAVWRLGRVRVWMVLVAVCFLSFGAAEVVLRRDPSAAFYLLPTRAWELMIGAFAALRLQGRAVAPCRWDQLFSGLGLTMILAAVLVYDHTTPFPGLYAAVPAVGTALIILFATPGTAAYRLLTLRGMVGIGLISYSAYLWHQPLFAFLRIHSLKEPADWQILAAAFLALCLAWVSWRLVEAPFRRRSGDSRARRRVLGGALIALAALSAVGLLGHVRDGRLGQPERIAALADVEDRLQSNRGLAWTCDTLTVADALPCRTGISPEVLLWGDSFAMHLAPGIVASDPAIRLQQFTASGCAPILGLARTSARYGESWAEACIAFNDEVLHWLEETESVRHVVLSSAFSLVEDRLWSRSGPLSDASSRAAREAEILAGLSDTISAVKSLDRQVTLVLPMPVSGFETGRCVTLALARGLPEDSCDFPRAEIRNQAVLDMLGRLPRDVQILSLPDLICDAEQCDTYRDGAFLYRDEGHLSREGSVLLGQSNGWADLIRAAAQ